MEEGEEIKTDECKDGAEAAEPPEAPEAAAAEIPKELSRDILRPGGEPKEIQLLELKADGDGNWVPAGAHEITLKYDERLMLYRWELKGRIEMSWELQWESDQKEWTLRYSHSEKGVYEQHKSAVRADDVFDEMVNDKGENWAAVKYGEQKAGVKIKWQESGHSPPNAESDDEPPQAEPAGGDGGSSGDWTVTQPPPESPGAGAVPFGLVPSLEKLVLEQTLFHQDQVSPHTRLPCVFAAWTDEAAAEQWAVASFANRFNDEPGKIPYAKYVTGPYAGYRMPPTAEEQLTKWPANASETAAVLAGEAAQAAEVAADLTRQAEDAEPQAPGVTQGSKITAVDQNGDPIDFHTHSFPFVVDAGVPVADRLAETVDRPRRRCPCIFPFVFKGYSYDGCTTTGYDQLWCGTVDLVMDAEMGASGDAGWVLCPIECPGWQDMLAIPVSINPPPKRPKQYNVTRTPGCPCVFPFIYRDISYSSCTMTAWTTLWCGTVPELPATGSGDWAVCEASCPGYLYTGVQVYGTTGCACVFPFVYGARTFNTCTRVSGSEPWCGTSPLVVQGSPDGWIACPSACPGPPAGREEAVPAIAAP
eukprot:gnl/TRDRNA2_/TRDRNA2_171995_c2_seq1.p1 gnl/TRDRNA2_/TRDRNA2_171995_c2~~gnl/TRDRNA2_/TRDRNA2_171995_c2_seq1.p1  ORF type:complete len:589 (+),score=98.63 gnl/TRDRNA2_/TRDRNA2_171995_c2_seq1:168-1934(+)